jgi:transcriptional regulator with XRE-family HTH domain
MIPIGKVLERARELQGLSRPELAERAGCNRSLVYKIEIGARSPHLETLEKFANALGIQVWEMVKIAQRLERSSRKRREKIVNEVAA